MAPSAPTLALPPELLVVPEEAREKVRAALLELRRTGGRVTVNAVQKLAGVKRDTAAAVLALHRERPLPLDVAWVVPPAPPAAPSAPAAAPGASEALEDLARAIESADTAKRLGECSGRAASLALRGVLDPNLARVVRDLVQERRRSVGDALDQEPPPEDPRTFLLASEGAMRLARAFDRIMSAERRDRIEGLVAQEFEADRAEPPPGSVT